MSYPSKTCQSDGLDPGEHGGMSYLTLGPREGHEVVSIDGRTLATMDDRKLAAALVGPEGSVAELQIRPGSSGAIRTVQVCRSRSG
jgi:hypothetical protein